MNKNPLISVVVPTKNRYYYLKKLIDLVESFGYGEELELIIQDNTEDNTEILKILALKEYRNVKYFYNKLPLTVGENCDLSIRNATGEYVCFIGDDDAVTRYVVDCARWMQKKSIERVSPERVTFLWPESYKGCIGDLFYKPFTGEVKLIQTNDVLNELLGDGCINTGNLPLLYRGVVKRSVLDKIWNQCGTYFPGASPDIANAVSLCLVVDQFAVISAPIAIGGNSKTGGGGVNSLKHHAETDFSKLSHLPKNITEIWCKRIPKIWSNPTIWCESVVEALMAWDRNDLVDKINFENLYEYFVVHYFYYRKMAFDLTNNKTLLILRSAMKIAQRFYNGLTYRISSKLLHTKYENGRLKLTGFKDFTEIYKHFDEKGYVFPDMD